MFFPDPNSINANKLQRNVYHWWAFSAYWLLAWNSEEATKTIMTYRTWWKA